MEPMQRSAFVHSSYRAAILTLAFWVLNLTAVAEERATLFRVVDATTKAPVVGATLHAITQAMPELGPSLHQTVVRATTDENGSARLVLDEKLTWYAWATSCAGEARRASFVRGRVPVGRSMRLELHATKTHTVRLRGLDAWREAVGSELRAVFVAGTPWSWQHAEHMTKAWPMAKLEVDGQEHGTISPVFRSELVLEGDEATLPLPALPFGLYYVALLGARGDGPYGERWCQQVPTPLEGCIGGSTTDDIDFGDPGEAWLCATTKSGRGIEGVTVLGQLKSGLVFRGQTETSGRCFLGRGHASYVEARSATTIERSEKVIEAQLDLTLQERAPSTLEVRGLLPSDRMHEVGPLCAVELQRERYDAATHVGHFVLEDDLAKSGLLLERDGQAVLLPLTLPRDPESRATHVLDLTTFVPVDFVVTDLQKQRSNEAGFVEVYHESDALSYYRARLVLSGRGGASTLLVPGRYQVLAWHPERGDACATFEVKAAQPATTSSAEVQRCQLELRPFVRVRGRVSCRDVDGPFLIAAMLDATRQKGLRHVERSLAAYSLPMRFTAATGDFEFQVSSTRVRLRFYAFTCATADQAGGARSSGSVVHELDNAHEVAITIR